MVTENRDYFNTRLTQELERNEQLGVSTKYEDIQRASREKVEILRAARLKQEEIIQSNKTSVVGQLGLSPDSTLGGAVNLGVSSVAGVADYVGTVGNAAANMAGYATEGQEFQDALNIDHRIAANEDTGTKTSSIQRRAADAGISALKGAISVPELAVGLASMVSGGHAGKLLEEAGFRPEEAKNFLDTLRTHEQQAASQKVGGAEGFWGTLGELADNPSVVPHALMESLFPMLAGGLAGRGLHALGMGVRAATAAGEGLVMAGSSAEQIRQKSDDGRLSLKQALSAAGTGVMGAGVARLGNAASARLGLGDVDQAIVEGTLGTTQRGLVTRTIGSSAMEGGEETTQSAGEQVLQNVALDKELSEGVGNASALGLVTGLAMGTPMALARGVGEVAEKAVKTADAKKVLQDAIASGDTTALLDPKSPAYAPDQAIAALIGNNQLPDATPEQKQANAAKAKEILESLASERDDILFDIKTGTKEGTLELIAENKAALTSLDPANPEDAEILADYQADIAALEKNLALHESGRDFSKDLKQRELRLSKIDRVIAQAKKNAGALSFVTNPAEHVAEQVEAADQAITLTGDAAVDAPVQQAAKAAAERVLVLAMESTDAVLPEQAMRLASNKDNGLTDAQRTYLRTYSDARLAENLLRDTDMVQAEILSGTADNKGIAQYRTDIARALAKGDRPKAQRLMNGLESFAVAHQAKAAAVASKEAQEPGNQVVRKNGLWTVAPEGLTTKQLRAMGGLAQPTVKLINTIKVEAAALDKAVAEMKAAFTVAGKTGASNVKNPPQQAAGSTQAKAKTATPAKASAPAAVPAPVAGAVPGPVSGKPGGAVVPVVEPAKPTATDAAVAPTPKTQSYSLDNAKSTVAVFKARNPKLLDALTELHAQDKTAAEISQELGIESDTVRELRRGLGLPEQGKASGSVAMAIPADAEERAVFEAWRDARKTVAPAPRVPQSTQEAPASAAEAQSTESLETSPVDSQSTVEGVEGKQESKESTTSVDTLSTPAEQDLAPEPVEQASSKGVLSTFSAVSPEGTPYAERNLIAEGWRQSAGKKGDATHRPLAAVKDFISAVLKDKSATFQDFLVEQLTEEKKQGIQHFYRFLKDSAGHIRANLPAFVKNKEYRYTDMMQFMLKEGVDGLVDTDENVKTAIAYASYSWAAEEATAPQFLRDAGINRLLGRDKDKRVSLEASKALSHVGTYQHMLLEDLGGRVLEALGLQALDTTPKDQAARLRVALGGHALKLLLDKQLIKRTIVMGSDMQRLVEHGLSEKAIHKLHKKQKPLKANTALYFFAVARNTDGAVHPEVEAIYQATKTSKNVLGDLFKVEGGIKNPSLKPITKVQDTTAKTSQGVPALMKGIVARNQANPRVVRKDMMGLLANFSPEEVHSMMGVTEEENETTHLVNRIAVTAKNDGLRRQFQLFMDYVGEHLANSVNGLDTPFFLSFSVWLNQRVGIDTLSVNPQTSKFVRSMIGSPEWTAQVDSTKGAQMESFFLRVAEGLGIKTERVSNEASVRDVQSKLADGVFVSAIAALRKSVVAGQELTAEEKDAVLAGVAAGKESMHSLDALIAVAYQQAAQESAGAGQPYTFTTQLMGEVDGVANGTMLNHVILGAKYGDEAMTAFLEQGGFYSEGSEFAHYNEYRGTPGNMDVYEATGRKVAETVAQYLEGAEPGWSAIVASIWSISGNIYDGKTEAVTKAGRDLIKGALNPLGFGSGMDNVVEGMADAFLASVYKGFEKLATKEDSPARRTELASLVQNINTLIGEQKYKLPTGHTLAWYMEKPLGFVAEIRVKQAFADTVGKTTSDVVSAEFAPFIERRDALNAAARATYGLYEAVYKGTLESYIEELIAAKELPLNAKGELIGDLNTVQEKELNRRLTGVLPILQTAMSKTEVDLKNGLLLAKTQRKQNPSSVYSNVVKFGAPLDTGAKSLNAHGFSTQQEDPGVSAGSISTHSLDSYISHMTQKIMDVLNVHDAVAAGVVGLGKAAQLMNQHTFEAVLNYSPLEEVYQSMSRVVAGIASRLESGDLSDAAKENLINFLKGHDGQGVTAIAHLLSDIKQEAAAANTNKYRFLSNLLYVDQYAFNGGHYAVTDTDRDSALAKLAAETAELSAKDEKSLETLRGLFTKTPQRAKTTPTPAVQEDVVQVFDAPDTAETEEDLGEFVLSDEPVTSYYGELGTPATAPDGDLVAFFKENSTTSASRVIMGLYRKYKGDVSLPNREFNTKLLQMLNKLVPADLRVQYVTRGTPKDVNLVKPKGNAHGWYSVKGDNKAVFVLSPEFVHSALTPEVLLHELVHAALAETIASELEQRQANPEYQSDALALIDELEVLRKKANTFATKNGVMGFDSALADIQEFVAWGMTNKDFQDQVLSQVTLVSKTKGNPLVSGMKAFLKALTGLLFKDSDLSRQAINVNGLSILISNVTGLMNQTAQNNTNKGREMTLSMSAKDPVDKVLRFNTLDIHQALDDGSVQPSFQAHLGNLLGGIVDKLHGPFGAFKKALERAQATTPLEAWMKALDTGAAPFASRVLTHIPTSQQEAFAIEQVEVTVRAALDGNEAQTTMVYKELGKLFLEMERKLKAEDFLKAGLGADLAAAQKMRDFVFSLEKSNGDKLDYLSRFAALGLAHEGFNKMLKVHTDTGATTSKTGRSFLQRLGDLYSTILSAFSDKVTNTFKGQQADLKMEALVGKLVDIEAKKRHVLAKAAERNRIGEAQRKVEEGAKGLADKAREKVEDLAGSKFFRENSHAVVRGAAALARTVAGNRVDMFIEDLAKLRDKEMAGAPGLLAGTLNYVRGPKAVYGALLRMAKDGERKRKQFINAASKNAMKAFLNEGKDLSKTAKGALSSVFLRSGAHVLLDTMSMVQLDGLLGNPANMKQAIADAEAKLSPFKNYQHYFKAQANALAYYKATGKVREAMVMMNAHNIAQMYGTQYAGRLNPTEVAAAEKAIETLVALYALEYTPGEQVAAARTVLRNETLRADGGNGVEFVLRLHKALEAESKERLFSGQQALMMHGYTPEIYNPHVEMAAASEAEGKELENQGYKKVMKLGHDRADPDPVHEYLYVLKDGGLMPYPSGAFNLKTRAAKGNDKHSGYLNTATTGGANNASMNASIAHAKSQAVRAMFQSGPRKDLSIRDDNYMAPVVNAHGEVVNWRYLMSEENKDVLLDRTNSFDKILGSLAGSIYDKSTSREKNQQVIGALKEQFDQEIAQNADSYINVGPKSDDPKMREIWSMLPDDAKEDIKAVWGKDGLMVRKDSLDIVFGYRKLSLATMFKKDPAVRNAVEKFLVSLVEQHLIVYARTTGKSQAEAEDYAKRAALYATKLERGWQELVKETKDIVVVKTGIVLVGNVWSNLSQLYLQGVPLKDVLHHHLVAYKGATAYQADTEELDRLRLLLQTGYTGTSVGGEAQIRRDILRLEDSIARNPVRAMIEDFGLMPSIVDDVEADQDEYSYKSLLSRKLEEKTAKLNPIIVKAGRIVYMAHDTKMYKALHRGTQLSDFMARYALMQHLTTRENKPLSEEAAAHEASETFVNYDLPMHRSLQYSDDMGLTYFTKYFLSIQRVLHKTLAENPARVLSLVALGNFVSLGPIVLSSAAITRIGGNPLEDGAFKLLRSVDDLATMKAATALIN